MLFVLTLGAMLGVAGITLIRQWSSGVLRPEDEVRPVRLRPATFPHLAPPRLAPASRTAFAPRIGRRGDWRRRAARVA